MPKASFLPFDVNEIPCSNLPCIETISRAKIIGGSFWEVFG